MLKINQLVAIYSEQKDNYLKLSGWHMNLVGPPFCWDISTSEKNCLQAGMHIGWHFSTSQTNLALLIYSSNKSLYTLNNINK